ncbi:MAG TPA: hypothetical protein VL371_15815 [Gemmataceae bacterium]|jgi:hypothetical protein|nr:hypothetical protein [Gemmataceae bacterium]
MTQLSPEEAQVVLIALDVVGEYGWDGTPSQILLASATAKLEEWAGDALADIRPLRVVDEL